MQRDDLVLLERWRSSRDAEAFDLLVSRYAGMVYAACRRILRNSSDAEEVTQECFLKLAQAGDRITSSLGGWLHRVATHQSLNRLKQDRRRLDRETAFASENTIEQTPAWNEIQSYVDEAIEQLPESSRALVIAHFLNRQTHEAIAGELGIPRRTVSYRIEKGVAQIRRQLELRGIRVGVTAVAGAMIAHGTEAAPMALNAALGRLAISGVAAPSTTAATGAMGAVLLVKGKLITAIGGLAVIAAIGFFVYASRNGPELPEPAIAPDQTDSEFVTPVESGQVSVPVSTAGLSTDRPAEPAEAVSNKRGWIADPAESIALSGHVVDEYGAPVPGATVEAIAVGFNSVQEMTEDFNGLIQARSGQDHMYRTETDKDGAFRIESVRFAGFIFLAAKRDGYTMGNDALGRQEPQLIQLQPGADKQDVLLVLAHGGFTLRGRVIAARSGAPVIDAHVMTLNHWLIGANTNENGNFTMSFSHEATVPVQVISDTYGRATFSNVYTASESVVTLEMPEPARVRGTIREDGARPAEGVQVILSGKWVVEEFGSDNELRGTSTGLGFSYRATTTDNGEYQIAGIDPGQVYEIHVATSNGVPLSVGEPLKLHPDGQDTVWDHEIARAGIVRGTVYGSESGRPLRDVFVGALKDGLPIGGSELEINPDGTYELRLVSGAGTYRIYPKYLFSEAAEMAALYGQEAYLKPGDEQTVDLRFPDPVTIHARLTNTQGEPVLTTEIGVNVPNRVHGMLRESDDAGSISFAGITPFMESWLALNAIGYLGASTQHRTGAPGQMFTEELVIYRNTAGIEGTLADAQGNPITNAPLQIEAYYADNRMARLSAQTDHRGYFLVVDGVPVAPSYFRVIANIEGNAMIVDSADILIQPETITHIGTLALR